MKEPSNHSRRDFLQGRAAAQTLVDKARSWAETTTELIDPTPPGKRTMLAHASRRAMACEFAVQYHVSDDVPMDDILAAFDLIDDLEAQLTVYREHSQVISINQHAANGPVKVESGLFGLLQQAATIYRETAGAFDITSSPLSRVWGFMRREGRMPEQQEIEAALSTVGFDRVELDSTQRTIRFLQPPVEINLNSIGKGYALDVVAKYLGNFGVNNYLWHGGRSSVLARGRNRADSRQAWTLGLRHPLQPERGLVEVHLRDQALATAGGATQFFEHQGRRYSHIFDPRTGWPAEGIFTATVIAPTAAEADALATAFYVMDIEAVAEYCKNHSGIGAILICPTEGDNRVKVNTFGLRNEDWTNVAQKPPSS